MKTELDLAEAQSAQDGQVAKDLVGALVIVSQEHGTLQGLLKGLTMRWEMTAAGLEGEGRDELAYGLYECADELTSVVDGLDLDDQMDIPAAQPERVPDTKLVWSAVDLREAVAKEVLKAWRDGIAPVTVADGILELLAPGWKASLN